MKKSIILSLLGHLTVFSIFNVSFGARLPRLDCAGINFRGAILSNLDLAHALRGKNKLLERHIAGYALLNKSNALILEKIDKGYMLISKNVLKPPLAISFNEHKMNLLQGPSLPLRIKNKPALMFYPRLPGYFNLYFKDRQVVHIELMFSIVSSNSTKSVIIKRKVSSGNLEADLLSLRYISHYLSMQHTQFAPGVWQTVDIDLSTKSD